MLRISPERIYNGDYTQARNSTIQKMLRMIGFGDNIGSGFMKIIKAWADLGFNSPEIHVEPEVNEVWLTLPLYFPCPGLSPAQAITNSLSPMRAEDNPLSALFVPAQSRTPFFRLSLSASRS